MTILKPHFTSLQLYKKQKIRQKTKTDTNPYLDKQNHYNKNHIPNCYLNNNLQKGI